LNAGNRIVNKTLNGLSEALFALNEGRGDLFSVVKSLALFVNALHSSDKQFVALNNDLAQFTNSFTNTDQELATATEGRSRRQFVVGANMLGRILMEVRSELRA